MQELGPNQRKWVEALRSGKYQQGHQALCKNGAFCCLGVACDVMKIQASTALCGRTAYGPSGDRWTGVLPRVAIIDMGLRSESGSGRDGQVLWAINDSGKTFAEIADLIEADPANWFTEAK